MMEQRGTKPKCSHAGFLRSFLCPFVSQAHCPIGWSLLSTMLVAVTIAHVTILTYIFYPGFLAPDSGTYLAYWTYGVPSQFRMVPLNLLFHVLMTLSKGDIFGIVLPQLLLNLAASIVSVRIVLPRSRWPIVAAISCLIVWFATRSFVFNYWVLSESLYCSLLTVYVACAIQTLAEPRRVWMLWLLNVLATSMLAVRPTGLLFVVFTLGLDIWLVARHRISLIPLTVLLVLVGCIFGVNKVYKGNFTLSWHTNVQLMITANRYIRYDTDYLAKEKSMIRENQRKILEACAPRTRLDEMVGGIKGVKGPWQILYEYCGYDIAKTDKLVTALIKEGLLSDWNLLDYLVDGFKEMMVLLTSKQDLWSLLPVLKNGTDRYIVEHLPKLDKNYLSKVTESANWEKNYLRFVYLHFITYRFAVPVGIVLAVFAYLTSCLILHVRPSRHFMAIMVVLGFLILNLYLTTLLVFANDRYYAQIEVPLMILLTAMLVRYDNEIVKKTKRPGLGRLALGLTVGICIIAYPVFCRFVQVPK
jgi:hypothetical protein